MTPRERQILTCIADGLTDSEISRHLVISEYTVKSHLKNLRRKLRADNRTHAVALALRSGVIV